MTYRIFKLSILMPLALVVTKIVYSIFLDPLILKALVMSFLSQSDIAKWYGRI